MNPSDVEGYVSGLNPLQGVIAIVIGLFLLAWLVLSFLAPFFWYGTSRRAKQISEKLTVLIELHRRNLSPPKEPQL